MPTGAAFLPGKAPFKPGPLQRYLPPLPGGIGSAWMSERLEPGDWVLDPFGASPVLPVELARAGYRILASVNNPIARFLLELYASPPDEAELRAALADLAATQKSGERIEPLIRSLYLTECAQCRSQIEAQAFIWEKEASLPAGRIYSCPVCKDSGERPLAPIDVGRTTRSATGGLHRSRALERVAALSDPDRAYAEEALAVYPGRAVYALFTMINHLEMLSPARRRLASALLLSAFDQTNGLWHHPPVRYRPRQLSLPQRFLEKNVWLAMEEAIASWLGVLSPDRADSARVPLTFWPDPLPETGGICLFEGRLKDLALQIQQKKHLVQIKAVAAALPRPNQAYWTLCALWAGWLWGQAASAPFKSVLRRRRYDWSWHVEALSAAFSVLVPLIEAGTPVLGLMGEAEPGFLSAALIAGELSGLDLLGTSLRTAQELAQIEWQRGPDRISKAREEETRRSEAGEKMVEFLKTRGEPASFFQLHAAAIQALVLTHTLPSGDIPPAEILRSAEASVETEMRTNQRLLRFGGTSRSLEVGQWWLNERLIPLSEIHTSLADRVEVAVVRWLNAQTVTTLYEVDAALCREINGLYTPDLELIQACLASYGEQVALGSSEIQLRRQDLPATRRLDLQEMRDLLDGLGLRLGFELISDKPSSAGRPPVVWSRDKDQVHYRFYLTASAVLGKILHGESASRSPQPAAEKRLIVLPGGRAGLVEYKLRRDQRLRKVLDEGWGFIKFRQVRWLAENENLRRDNLDELLELDPLSNRDPQIPLL